MRYHRLAEIRGNELHFVPEYRLRFLIAWVVIVGWAIFAVSAFTQGPSDDIGKIDSEVLWLVARYGSVFVLGGALVYLRGEYLYLDRGTGRIMLGKGFSGWIRSHEAVGEFDVAGKILFQYCQAELQSLCVMTYVPPSGGAGTVLHIYTMPQAAAETAQLLRTWEPQLVVEEVEDQSALPTARNEKPLVH